ncbi:hypothetical protein KPH14_006563 [Odynerus spinipes]|uniref:Uncharacterized protein n=1 Tax=Odynerus spinipes TaxID=1348599 RepID=A0AAD9RQQ1_9HYME|nr:hypothetical protein KPH14_006563 [Odynerus spinipes]
MLSSKVQQYILFTYFFNDKFNIFKPLETSITQQAEKTTLPTAIKSLRSLFLRGNGLSVLIIFNRWRYYSSRTRLLLDSTSLGVQAGGILI